MSSTATSVRPGRPPRAEGGRTAESRRGVTGVGASRSFAPVHASTGSRRRSSRPPWRAPRQVAADHRVAGEGHDLDRRAGDARRDLERDRGRGAEVLPAGEDQRRHVGERCLRRRRGRGVGPRRARRDEAAAQRRDLVERREVDSPAGPSGRPRLRPAASLPGSCAATGTAPPRRSSRRTALRRFPRRRRRSRGRSARSGSGPPRAPGASAAGRIRRAAPSGWPPAAAPAAPGSDHPRAGRPAGAARPSVRRGGARGRRRPSRSAAGGAGVRSARRCRPTGSGVMPAHIPPEHSSRRTPGRAWKWGSRRVRGRRLPPPSRAPSLRRAGGSVRRTPARPWCRRRCRTGRASSTRWPCAAPRCPGRFPGS